MVDKAALHAKILEKLEEELANLLKAAAAAYDGAVHEEAVSKSKYETHGLELSYLAGSQFERCAELQRKIQGFKAQAVRYFANDEAVGVGALVALESAALPSAARGVEAYDYVYLCQVGAGLSVNLGGLTIQIATPVSPLGSQLLHTLVGDELELPAPRASQKLRRLAAIY